MPGGQIAYTLEIENKGTTVAYGVKISDTLPAEVDANSPFDTVTLLKLTDEDGNTVYPVDTAGIDITTDITVERVDSGSTYTWYLGLAPGNEADPTYYRKVGIPAGAIMSFDIFVTINGDTADQTTITNPAQVTVDRQNDLDPEEKYLVNNTDSAYVNVYRADLTTDKTVVDVATGSETQTSAGSVLSYTVTYNNIGNTAAEDAILADNLPTNTCLILGSIDNPAGTSIEYSNNDGSSWDYAPSADSNGTDCDVTDYRIVFGSAIPAPANSYGEAPANLSLPSGPLLWLDGSDESTIESTCSPTCGVSEWRDKSGNSHHFTQTVNANMPITLNNGINFDGSNDFLEFGQLPNPEDVTLLIVLASDTASYTKNGSVMSNRSANGLVAHPWAGAEFDFALETDGGSLNHLGQYPIANKTSPHILALTFDDETNIYQQLLNGSVMTSGTRNINRDSGTTGQYFIGSDDQNVYGGRFEDGTIYEIVMYDRAFSSAELDQAARYLSVKWGIPYTGGDNVVFDGTLLDQVCGNGSASSPFVDVGCLDGVATGTYWFNIGGNTFQGYVDGDTDGGGWLMVLNYLHVSTNNAPLDIRTSDLPLFGSSTLTTTDEAGTSTWGHASNTLMADLAADELRFFGKTANHTRVIHFTTKHADTIDYFETGSGDANGIQSSFTALSDHTAYLPGIATHFYDDEGNTAMTEFPFYRSGNEHWGIKGSTSRWEVDNYTTSHTHHQIFIRKDKLDVYVPPADHLVSLAPLPNVSCDDAVICAPFDEGTGTTTEDISGNDNDLTLNSVPWIDNRDERGTYLDFTADGTSDYAVIEDFDMPTDDFTVSLWASSDYDAGEEHLVSYAVPGEFNELMLYHDDGVGFRIHLNGNGTILNAGNEINATGWHHIALSRNSTSGITKLFIDGTRVYSTTVLVGTGLDAGGTLVLGQEQDGLGGGFSGSQELEGYMDDFRIYGRELSEADILAIADGSAETTERFKTTGTYTTTITADDNIGAWDKLLVGQDLPDGSDITYEIYDAAGTTSLFGPSSAPAGFLDISSIDASNKVLTLVVRMSSDNSGQTCLKEWQATYSSDTDPSFTFQARVDDMPVDPSLVHNEVSISTTTPETDLTNNDGFDDISVETVNLLVEKLVDPSAVLIGETITYTINYENEGPGTAANVVLTDTLPISVTHVSSTPSIGTCNAPSGQSVTCDLGTVGPLATGTITVVVTADVSAADEIIFNGVEIGSTTNEVTLSDNIDSVPTYVGNIANIAITKVGPNAFSNDEGTAVELGQLITYTLSYENNGTGNATSTIITDTLPISTTYSGYSAAPAATCTESSGVFTCTLGTLVPGDSGTIDLGITINNDTDLIGTTLENITVIATDEAETTLADNSDSFENPVELKPAALAGYVWFDTDQDVDRELATGEGPIPGVEIQLTGIDIFGNSVVMTTTTDSTGFYAFSNLNPSDGTGYTLTEIQPEGYESTGSDIGQIAGSDDLVATNPSADQITGIILSSGEQGQHYNFGEVAPVTIGDIVWNDYNGNGQQDDGEAVLPGVTVSLYEGGLLISTTVTAGDGTYLFTNDGADPLYDGDYFVEFTAPVGYTFTVPNANGVNDVVDSDADPSTGRTPTFTADLGDEILTLDAGFLIPSSIGDTVWLDLDGDGNEDEGEPGIPGVVITATAGSGLVFTTTTDSDGFYEFTGLGADTFTITVDTSTLPTGLTQTGDPGGNSSLDNTHAETLNPGDDVDTVDFGYQGTGSIGDTVWLDLDGDGDEDAGEGGIGGVVITLTAASGFEITTTTTITGFYEFTNLPADDYTITVDTNTLPDGVTQTGDPDSTLDHQNSVTLGNGQNIDTVDFGYIGDSSLGDRVWQDLDGDGDQDPGEPPIPGVVITLTQPSGAVVTATTTITGFYEFTGLAAGTYQVDVDTSTVPAGLTQTGDPGGIGSLDDSHTQVLGANQDIDTVDFGYRSGGSLGDTVWYDLNNNGVEDPGEPGIPGVVISLTLPNNVVITTTTAANGFYQFTGLGTGNHTVTVDTATLPAGLSQSGDPDSTLDDEHVYNLGNNENADTVDFGYIGNGSIGDTIWEDLDGDGLEGGTEPGIGGVVITLTTGTGGVITTTTTITGFYEFPNLPADTYTVTVDADTLPDGYGQSGDPDSTLDHTHTTILTTGEDDDTVDFGYLTGAEVGNFVWHDVDGDGIQDIGEDGLSGITVTLTVSDTGQIFTVTTNASGYYSFTNLLPGDYHVTFYPPDDYTLTGQNAGVDGAVDSDADPVTGATQTITLTSGQSDMTWDAGLYEPVALGNYVWADEDADGLQDFGEQGISGITVTLILSGTGPISTTVTNSAGLYEFDNLPPGTYSVLFTQPADHYPTKVDEGGDDALDSDSDLITLQTDFVTLESGDVDNTLDAGFYPGGSLGDYAWEDLNGDGIQDVGEPPVPGVTVTLYLSGTGQISTTVTGPDGGYLFDGLEQGTYTVTFGSPVGYEIIDKPDAGSNDTVDSDADPTTGQTGPIVLGPNEDNPTIDVGLYQPASLGDLVWADENGNGIQDDGEIGFQGITVTLIVSGTGIITTTVTDADGNYTFDGLPPGDYIVEFALPDDYIVSPFERGGDDAEDSNTLFLGNQTEPITLESGENNPTIDVGLYHPLQVGDRVWFDANDNGVQDPLEIGIDDVVLRLLDSNGVPVLDPTSSGDGVVYTTTTSAGGFYSFDYLAPGDYVVEIVTDNFVAWDAPLYGFLSSLSTVGSDPADPDNDSNSDDNGVNSLDPVVSEGTSGLTVTLGFGSEPTGDSPTTRSFTFPDTSSNLTVDFGFFEMLTLGNLIWNDQDSDGIQDPGEPGMPAGIVLELRDGNGDPILNPVTGQPITTTTQAGGFYQFTNLAPGDYVIFIAPENFLVGGPLEGYAGSTGSSDPDDDSDIDDNGIDENYPTINGIYSQPITLSYQDEPDNQEDGDNNANTNLTVDFGLVQVPTAVELLKFEAKVIGPLEIRVAWATGSEIDNFGFRLMRSSTASFDDAEQIHFESSAVTSGPGSTYAFWDTVVEHGTYTYWLIDVETTGRETVHPPVSVKIVEGIKQGGTFNVYLPIVPK